MQRDSGDLYIVEFSGDIPEDTVIETDDNRAGNIKGGATLEYSIESQTVQDDKGRVKKTIITKETVTFKTGLMTWVKQFIQAIIQTARIDETTKTGHRLRITVTGKNTGTISLAFQPENETTVDAEITADTLDSAGTLVILDDEMLTSTQTTNTGS